MDKVQDSEDTQEQEAAQLQPGDFPINAQDMMADYEAQIAAKSREAMLERMKNKALMEELNGIKETLMGLQGRASHLGDKPVARKKAPARKR